MRQESKAELIRAYLMEPGMPKGGGWHRHRLAWCYRVFHAGRWFHLRLRKAKR
jgi:hypothetical protein